MARLALAIQTIGRAGVDIGAGQAVLNADEAEVVNDGTLVLKLDNTTGGAIVVTFITPQQVLTTPALPVGDQTFSVPANNIRWIGPFPTATFNNSSGKMDIDVPADGITMTAVKIGSGA